MSIVLNEYDWAERAIKDKALGKKPYETLSRVAKYYTYKNYARKEVRRLLDEFLLQCEPAASLVTWSDTLDSATKYATKYPLIMIDEILVTKTEMEKIDSLSGKQLRRLAFTLLCISKYLYTVSENANYWVNTPDNEIMKMANINTITASSTMSIPSIVASLFRWAHISATRPVPVPMSRMVESLPMSTQAPRSTPSVPIFIAESSSRISNCLNRNIVLQVG